VVDCIVVVFVLDFREQCRCVADNRMQVNYVSHKPKTAEFGTRIVDILGEMKGRSQANLMGCYSAAIFQREWL
jgi:hypothetical protein